MLTRGDGGMEGIPPSLHTAMVRWVHMEALAVFFVTNTLRKLYESCTKAPPKHPFTIQIALKSSLDVFYFTVPCSLHSLISRDPS